MPEKPRNILLVQCDSMDGRAMGCQGHPALGRATPHLDALANRGVIFSNGYSNNPICCPSRASMWSGRFTHHCEGWNNFKGLDRSTPTFRTHLERAGYQWQSFGKQDYLSGFHTHRARVSAWTRSAAILRPQYRTPPPRIIDEPRERVHDSDWTDVDAALRWLSADRRTDGGPFLLYVGLRQPHPPFRTSARYLSRIDESGISVPAPDPRLHPVMRHQQIVKNWSQGFAEETVREVRRIYFAMIAEVDAMVGRLLDGLAAQGLTDSTTVIFLSDHGELALEHQQHFKMNHYEPAARVPMILAGPGLMRDAVVDDPVSLVDLFPTLLDLAGLSQPPGIDGHSLLPEAGGRTSARPDWVLAECHDSSCQTGMFMLRRGPWKYIAYPGFSPMLFELDADPSELRDRSADRPEIVGDLDRRLRSIVDYEIVDAKVKEYDRRSFRQWRDEHRKAGDYDRLMARIFSGWDHVAAEDAQPWTAAEEEQIVAWMDAP